MDITHTNNVNDKDQIQKNEKRVNVYLNSAEHIDIHIDRILNDKNSVDLKSLKQ